MGQSKILRYSLFEIFEIFENEIKKNALSRHLRNNIQKYFGLRDSSSRRFFWNKKETKSVTDRSHANYRPNLYSPFLRVEIPSQIRPKSVSVI